MRPPEREEWRYREASAISPVRPTSLAKLRRQSFAKAIPRLWSHRRAMIADRVFKFVADRRPRARARVGSPPSTGPSDWPPGRLSDVHLCRVSV